MSNNIVWHDSHISKEQRSQQKKQKPCVIWFTGLSGSGKSTLAKVLCNLISNKNELLN